MSMIHFLKHSSSILWISYLIIAISGIGLTSSDGYASGAEGVYSGTFDGERKGGWFLQTDSSGGGQIYFWLKKEQVIDMGKVNVNDSGNFTFKCTYGLSGTGSIKDNGNVEGNWKYNGITGGFKGSLQDQTKLKGIAGTYSSNCSGNESGELILIVANNGSITGTVTWEKNGLVEEGSGAINSAGDFIFHTQDDTNIFGTLKSFEDVKGHWNNPFWETKGTVGTTAADKSTSKAISNPTSETMPVYAESQEDSGNGCFIKMVIPN